MKINPKELITFIIMDFGFSSANIYKNVQLENIDGKLKNNVILMFKNETMSINRKIRTERMKKRKRKRRHKIKIIYANVMSNVYI